MLRAAPCSCSTNTFAPTSGSRSHRYPLQLDLGKQQLEGERLQQYSEEHVACVPLLLGWKTYSMYNTIMTPCLCRRRNIVMNILNAVPNTLRVSVSKC
jgi:hypothetical protein